MIRRLALVVTVVVACAASGGVATARTTDHEVARAGVLLLSDFPAGWTERTRGQTTQTDLDTAAASVRACKPFVAFSKANEKYPRARSHDFEEGNSDVTSAVSVYPSAVKASGSLQLFADRRVPTCFDRLFTTVFRAQLAKQRKVANQVTSIRTDVQPVTGVRIGDEAVVYQGRVDVALKGGTSETIGLGFVAVRVDDALARYSYTADTDISSALQPAIVASVSRLQHAQSGA